MDTATGTTTLTSSAATITTLISIPILRATSTTTRAQGPPWLEATGGTVMGTPIPTVRGGTTITPTCTPIPPASAITIR